ncbi:MAG: SDR family oxidoreductase [Oscillatoriales cyanobacterium RM2_1_1]|nr:SDR family oxidoreductase [Oscillatoriales cyanobacterium SM2_3_0]NJO47363.1 SDR family oxidoreductase [Oscillatoriales cyanobacterium RM2_1_1]
MVYQQGLPQGFSQTFSQQHTIITGGSSGIGKATALLLAQAGARITLIGRHPEKLAGAKAEITATLGAKSGSSSTPSQVLTLAADVADRSQAEQAIKTAIDQLGVPDLLITSAGMAHPGHFQDLPIEIFEQTMAVNYFGSLYCIRAVLPSMVTRHQGDLVMISSGVGLIGIYGYTPYSPTKFALRGLAESLRGELKPLGIGVAIVYPPDTQTPQLEAENLTKPLATQQITATAKTWQPEAIAHEILRGIQRRQFTITPGLEMSLLNRFQSLLAPGLQWYFDRITAKALRVRHSSDQENHQI